ncbi:MAG: hypothetical protein P1S46_12185 [bacterium]|nr:hypothetical protein [bacterium]
MMEPQVAYPSLSLRLSASPMVTLAAKESARETYFVRILPASVFPRV